MLQQPPHSTTMFPSNFTEIMDPVISLPMWHYARMVYAMALCPSIRL